MNGVAQSILPNWVRAHTLVVYLTVFNSTMTAGSLVWGAVAKGVGVPPALLIGATGLVLVV